MPTRNAFRIDYISIEKRPPLDRIELRFGDGINLVRWSKEFLWPRDITQAIFTGLQPEGKGITVSIRGDHKLVEGHWTNILINDSDFPRSMPQPLPDDDWVRLGQGNPSMLRRLSELLTDTIGHKPDAPKGMFSRIPNCGRDTLTVEILPQSNVVIRAGRALLASKYNLPKEWDGTLMPLFESGTPRFLLHLCGVIAAREHLKLDCPLILDGTFTTMEYFAWESTFARLRALGQQVIVFEGSRNLEAHCQAGDNIVHACPINPDS